MHQTSLAACCAGLAIIVVGTAMLTDLRWRRIPNFLTLPAIGLAIGLRVAFQGWPGLAIALGGAIVAPVLLLLLHGGKGLGMGDLKLAAAIGAIVGPLLGAISILVSAIAGGFLAIVWLLKPGGVLAEILSVFLSGINPKKKKKAKTPPAKANTRVQPMPYGVALAIGSVVTLAVCWWTGDLTWLL